MNLNKVGGKSLFEEGYEGEMNKLNEMLGEKREARSKRSNTEEGGVIRREIIEDLMLQTTGLHLKGQRIDLKQGGKEVKCVKKKNPEGFKHKVKR